MPGMLLLTSMLAVLPQGEAQLSGRVLDVAGHPAAGATVTLLHRPIPRHLDPAREHRLVVTTDDRGAFRTALRADTIYSVWAATADAASRVEEGVESSGFLELRTECGSGPERIPIAGLQAWTGVTLSCRAVVGSEALDFVPAPIIDGTAQVPAMPPMASRTFELLTADGRVLWATQPRGEPGLVLPPPKTFSVLATDANGAPLQGVDVMAHVVNYWATESQALSFDQRFRSLWPSQGTTGADGRLELRLPVESAEKPLVWLLSRKDGHRLSFDGLYEGKHFKDGAEVPADPKDAERIHVVLTAAAAPPPVPLRGAGDQAFAQGSLFVVARVHVRLADTGEMGMPFHLDVPVRDGAAVMPFAWPEGTEFELAWTQLAPAVRVSLRERQGFAPPALFRLPRPPTESQLDLARWRVVQVVSADGRPAAHCVVQVRQHYDEDGSLLRTDRRGRVWVEVNEDKRDIAHPTETRVSVYGAAGCGGRIVPADAPQPVVLTLRDIVPATVTLIDADDRPVAGASVETSLTEAEAADDFPNEHYTLTSLLPPQHSDEQGRVRVVLPPYCARIEFTCRGRHEQGVGKLVVAWDPASPSPLAITLR
jgi:hypothetical protein